MSDLFSNSLEDKGAQTPLFQPLAERARPKQIDEFYGQSKFLGHGKLLRDLLSADRVPSLILWGPPGCGKTTFAGLISQSSKALFVNRSAIDTGAKDLKEEGEGAKQRLERFGERTILFIDEIHRLNKSQQDCLLPYIEKGYFSLIGATTENPSFELNSALLSRCRLIVFEGLDDNALGQILDRGLPLLDEKLKWEDLSKEPLREQLIAKAAGDGRRCLNLLENVFNFFNLEGRAPLTAAQIEEALGTNPIRYDKSRDRHYDVISAFIKSIRGSDPNAALYYLALMLKGGEEPLFIARRLVILASEDISNADPRALQVALNVKDAVEFVGLPECAINLAQGVTYLATAPKSNRSYVGLKKSQALVEENPGLEVPLTVRNAQTKMMKGLGYGEDYEYSHDESGGVGRQNFLPKEIESVKLYEPTNRGYEKQISAYMQWVRDTLEKREDKPTSD